MRRKNKKGIQVKVIEVCCYVAGAGAFGVFFRWMQDQMAFTEEGLADPSAFNFIVPAYIIIAAIYFSRLVNRMKNSRYYLTGDFCTDFVNDHILYKVLRWFIGAVMAIGGLILLATCEVEKEAVLLRILALFAILAGISFPIHLGAANYDEVGNYKLLCLFSIMPVLMFSVWLITSYKMNAINSVVWAYAIEIISVIIALLTFFRIAGYAFGNPKPFRCLFYCMYGTGMCIMALADERNMGMQLIFLGAAAMLLLYTWVLVSNLKQKEAPSIFAPDDGFERL